MSNIAHLETISNVLDTTAKFVRVMAKEGVTTELLAVTDNREARRNLAAYLKAGCPKLGDVPMVPKPALLALANGQVEYPALDKPHDPHAFYQTRDGLYIWGEFNERILANVKSVEKLDACTGKSYDLRKNAKDSQITAELPEGYEWDPSELCARIAQMIEKQWGGRDGELLNNGYANLFYVPGFVVYVFWLADSGYWFVNAGGRDDYYWSAGYRVFPRN